METADNDVIAWQYCITVRPGSEETADDDWVTKVEDAITEAAGGFSSSVNDGLDLRIHIHANPDTGTSCIQALRAEGFDADGHAFVVIPTDDEEAGA